MSSFPSLSQSEQLDRLWRLSATEQWLDLLESELSQIGSEQRSWRVAEFSVRLKDSLRYDDAIRLINRFFDPSNEHHHYQLGLCLSYGHRQQEACQHLEQAFIVSGGSNYLIANDYIINLSQLGYIDKARESLRHLRSVDVVDMDECERLLGMVELLNEYPPSQILSGLDHALADRQWLSVDGFLERIKCSLLDGEGFAFFRLDDGEGANLPWSQKSLEHSSSLLNYNRDVFLGHWFGVDGISPALESGWIEIQDSLAQAAGNVDLIGLNTPERYRHELSVNSARGIPAILNTYLWTLLRDSPNSDQEICHAQMHFELGLVSDRFFDVVRCASSLHLISSRQEFASLMHKVAPSLPINFIPIPGERLRVSRAGDARVESEASTHFPDRYYQVIDEISQTAAPGSLWLIGAGLLAKLYCMRIREMGGVALDLGSLIDIYSGVNSRGFQESMVERIQSRVNLGIQ